MRRTVGELLKTRDVRRISSIRFGQRSPSTVYPTSAPPAEASRSYGADSGTNQETTSPDEHSALVNLGATGAGCVAHMSHTRTGCWGRA